MPLLAQFILRLSFGLALAMGSTSPKQAPAGYFRVHSYVLLGLNALATFIAFNDREHYALWPPLAAAALSYASSVIWLYEKPKPGIAALWSVAACSLAGAWLAGLGAVSSASSDRAKQAFIAADAFSGGLLLGAAMAAMLLGHWYLNSPGMKLEALRRLVLLMACAAVLRAAVSGWEMAAWNVGGFSTAQWLLVSLRWLSGIAGTLLLAYMTWQTLKIPNTQAATGILYVAVIATFLGELTAQLLSASPQVAL